MIKILNNITSVIAGAVLLLSFWLTYIIFSLYSLQPENTESVYSAPENAEVIVHLDGRAVLKNILIEVLFEGKGDAIYQKIRTLPRSSASQKQYGINWAQPVTYFRTTYNGKEVQGLIVQVINPVEWNKNINTLLGNTSVAKYRNYSGIVVQSGELTKEELYDFVEQRKVNKATGLRAFEYGKFITVHQKSDSGNTDVSVSVDKNVLSSRGMITHDGKLKSNPLNFVLTPSDLHFTSDLITQDLNDTLKKYTGVELALTGISLNYRGGTLAGINGKNAFIPDVDFIVGFERETDMWQVVEAIPDVVWEEEGKTVRLGKQIYHIKQLDARTIFVGVNKNAEWKANSQSIGISLNGSLKPLFNIQGNSLIRAAFRLNPASSFGLDLSEEIQNCSIRLTSVSAGVFQLDASFHFKNEDDAILKILEIVLKRQV